MVVDLVAAALNRRDWWIRRGGKATLPAVLGSDGAGVVSALGTDVTDVAMGDEVVIYPGFAWGDASAGAGLALGLALLGMTTARRVQGRRVSPPSPAQPRTL